MPPRIKKGKKTQKVSAPPAAETSNGPEEQLAISGQLDKKMKKSKARMNRQRGLVAIRHLPHGFFEEQLKGYFQQFGTVTRLRLCRSKHTGGSKGFAFVEFEYPEVAKVAAETMDNYLMFQKVVKASYIPPEAQRYNYFKSSVRKVMNKVGRPIYVSGQTAAIQRRAKEYNNWSDEAYQKRIASSLEKLEKLKEKYAHLDIDFDDFTVKPNIQKVEEKASPKKDPESTPEPGSVLLLNDKQKQTKGKKKVQTAKPKVPKKIELKDLLENTLNDEESDEDADFIPGEDDSPTSDEENYGFEKSVPAKAAVSNKKPKTKVDRMAELIKRKPNAGGIKKQSAPSKTSKTKLAKPSIAMSNLKATALKEMKQGGKLKQMKKAEFNKTKANKKRKV